MRAYDHLYAKFCSKNLGIRAVTLYSTYVSYQELKCIKHNTICIMKRRVYKLKTNTSLIICQLVKYTQCSYFHNLILNLWTTQQYVH